MLTKKKLRNRIEYLEKEMGDLRNCIAAMRFTGTFDLNKTEVVKDLGYRAIKPSTSFGKYWSLRYINHLGQLKTQGFTSYVPNNKPEVMESDREKAIIYFKGSWYQLNKATGTTFEIPEPAKYAAQNTTAAKKQVKKERTKPNVCSKCGKEIEEGRTVCIDCYKED